MIRLLFLCLFLLFPAALRADLILEQKTGDTNHLRNVTIKLHGDKMRQDQGDDNLSVIVDLKTRDSFTLIHNGKTYMRMFGSEIRWQMAEKKKYTGGTNEMDAPAAWPVDTGKSEIINGQVAQIFTWSGAQNLSETLWVVTNFPNYNAIKAELLKLDQFNDSGPHRNAQPPLSPLPGMVIKSENVVKGHTITTMLVSVKLEPVAPSLFEVPIDYSPYERTQKNNSP